MTRVSYLTVAQTFRLNVACQPITKAFGCPPYLVGSVLTTVHYRDVDLRLPMSVERAGTDFWIDGDRRALINVAISDWLGLMTGLPIDFQFQEIQEFAEYDGEMRNPMGIS